MPSACYDNQGIKMKSLILLFVFSPIFLASQYAQAETITRSQADELMSECQAYRQQQIAPLKAIEIDNCINEQNKEAAYCKRYYRDYGESFTQGNGTFKLGLYWDYPTCAKALKAEKYFKLYPGSDIFEL